jgi:hypothetical protein
MERRGEDRWGGVGMAGREMDLIKGFILEERREGLGMEKREVEREEKISNSKKWQKIGLEVERRVGLRKKRGQELRAEEA